MPEDVMVFDDNVAQMLLKKLGKKFVTKREVMAMTMDQDFELHVADGVVQGQAGDIVAHDEADDKYLVFPPDAFGDQYKTPRTRKAKSGKTEPGRPSLPPHTELGPAEPLPPPPPSGPE